MFFVIVAYLYYAAAYGALVGTALAHEDDYLESFRWPIAVVTGILWPLVAAITFAGVLTLLIFWGENY